MSRVFTAYTPLGDDLKFYSLSGREEMSRLFECTLTLASLDNSVAMNALLGQSLTVEIEREDKSKRYFNGFAVQARQVKRDGRYFLYEATVRPQLWFLTQTKDFKVFQKMTARDIIKQVLSEFGVLIKDQLTGYYRMRDYTVQYGESAFDFVSRLMEEEGAGYWFEHSMGVHTMVLSDSISAYPVLPSHAVIPYYPEDMAGIPDEEYVNYWGVSQTVNPGKYTTIDYDFKKPKANLEVQQPKPRDHAHNTYEVFNFPGVYREVGDGENYAKVNIESQQTYHERADGYTNVRGLAPGYRFTLSRCPRSDQNREYLIVSADYNWVDNSYEGGAGSKIVVHETKFNAQPTSDPYRPERITPQPDAKGPDSAVVTGPAGEEIWTDEHARIKAHFHWDRHGPKDENSSCWIRVAHPWAGTNYGGMHIPRIGQEILIEYVNGNPDHPVVTSRVYNNDQMPPWKLPFNATQSGFQTRWSKGGGGASRLRFEDKKGIEHLELSNDYGFTQLNMGYLLNQGTLSQRGYGFELRTNLWGSVRADKGLLLTTYTQDHTTTVSSDNIDGHDALGAALVSGKARADAGKQAVDLLKNNIQQHVQSKLKSLLQGAEGLVGGGAAGAADALKGMAVAAAKSAVADALGGGGEIVSAGMDLLMQDGHDPAIAESDLMHTLSKNMAKPIVSIASPEGQTLHSPKPVVVGSGQSVSVHAKNHITMTSASRVSIMAAKGMNTHVEKGGQTSVVSGGDWGTQVTAGAANLITQANTNITSKAADVSLLAHHDILIAAETNSVHVVAKENITFACGESFIVMKKDGTILIKGKNGTIDFSALLDIHGKPIQLNCMAAPSADDMAKSEQMLEQADKLQEEADAAQEKANDAQEAAENAKNAKAEKDAAAPPPEFGMPM